MNFYIQRDCIYSLELLVVAITDSKMNVLFILIHCAYFTFALPIDIVFPEGNFPTFRNFPIQFGVRPPNSPFSSPAQFSTDFPFHSDPGRQPPSVTIKNPIPVESPVVKVENLKKILEEIEEMIKRATDIKQSVTNMISDGENKRF